MMSLVSNALNPPHGQSLRLLGTRLWLELLAGTLAALGLTLSSLQMTPSAPLLAIWLLVVVGISLGRYGAARLCQSAPGLAGMPRLWLGQFYAGTALTGLAWGWLGVIAAATHSTEFLAYTLFASTALSYVVLGLYPGVLAAFAAHSVPALLPPLLAILRAGEPLILPLAVLATLFAGYAASTAIHYRRQRLDGLRRAQEQVDLRRELALRDSEIEKLRIAHKSSMQSLISTRTTLDALRKRLGLAEGLTQVLTETVDRTSLISELTGIANRRAFDQALVREWQRLRRDRRPLSLVVLDLDNPEGDRDLLPAASDVELLKGIAQILKSFGQRAGDLAVHDERGRFMLLLPEANSKSAVRIAKRLHAKVEAARLPRDPAHPEASATVHAGVATLIPTSHFDPEELVTRTDSALYEAQFQGGNRVVIHRALRDLRIDRWAPEVDGALSERGLRHKLALWGMTAEPLVTGEVLSISDQVHDTVAVLALLSGQLRIHVEGDSLGLHPGDCLFLPAGTTYSAEGPPAEPVTISIGLPAQALGPFTSPELRRAV